MEQEDFPNVVVVTFVGHKGDERSIVVKGASSVTNALDTAVKNHLMASQYWNGGVSRIKVATYLDTSGVEMLEWRLELTREVGELLWNVDDRYGDTPTDGPYVISMPWEGERG